MPDLSQELYEMSDTDALCRRAAELILAVGRKALQECGRFTFVLTGGRTVQTLYRYLAGSDAGRELHDVLARTDFFLGDERWVPEEHPDSNGGMVRRLLLDPLGIAAERTFLIRTGFASPEDSAADYEKTLRRFFAERLPGEGGLPEFDLMLLGMGNDGHIASLFQGTEALQEKERWVTTSFPPSLTPAVDRITMTLPLINRAREVVFLLVGDEKVAIARKIMAAPLEAARLYPAGLIKSLGRNIWLLADS